MYSKRDLEKKLSKYYVTNQKEWVQVDYSPAGFINITVVSDKFEGKSKNERFDEISRIIGVDLSQGFIYLFTVKEAAELDLFEYQFNGDVASPKSWGDLSYIVQNNLQIKPSQIIKEKDEIRTVAFYSYKGGVGRTAALVHVAVILAKRGKKVLLIDLDLEAPSLHNVINNISPNPKYGIVDYLYERAYSPTEEYKIHISDIFGEVHLENTPGRIFVIPAGKINFSYISKVDDLRVSTLLNKNVWETLKNDIVSQVNPDIILVDSRTGINEWGAFSLFEVASDIIFFMYPNEENLEGLNLISKGLSKFGDTGKTINFVLTKVPSNKDGKKKAESFWEIIKEVSKYSQESLETQQIELEFDDSEEFSEDNQIVIHYNPDIALADCYPIEHLQSTYAPIANLIDEETEQYRLRAILSGTNRWEIIDSLEFGTVDAKDEQKDLSKVFQKTSDFDKFVDENTAVIHGQKGTGKTALYWMLLRHFEESKRLSKGRLDKVIPVSGHGPFSAKPGKEEFRYFFEKFKGNFSWETFWRAYAVLRLYIENKLPPFRHAKFVEIGQILKSVKKRNDFWTQDHTNVLFELVKNLDLNLLLKDYLTLVNDTYRARDQSIWLLYDDLDEDIQERSVYQNDALSGLFYFIRAVDGQKLTNIKFKVFIREDIWERLNFTNKSHFNGRDVLLQWSRIDFLRLALRQSLYSQQYKELVDKFYPIQDPDNANEESILNALQILWGMRREKNRNSKYVGRWVYERLTDASGTTFPRVLGLLLNAAKEHELQYMHQPHVPPPTDRLLRSQSLNAGLFSAAKHRSNELREEYPELEHVFSRLENYHDICSRNDLERMYKECYRDNEITFDEFVSTIKSIGLANEVLNKGEIQYKFADLYVHGFGMKRSHGRKL